MAAALIPPLAWELPYAVCVALRIQKKKKKKKGGALYEVVEVVVVSLFLDYFIHSLTYSFAL